MIPFNVFGHTKRAGGDDNIPIVWVDADDTGSYTLSGSDVLTLLNKGSLGGAMTLNGSVKFANNGFESWAVGNYITYDLGGTFLPTNSFTIATTYDLTTLTFPSNNRGYFSSLFSNTFNRAIIAIDNGDEYTTTVSTNVVNTKIITATLSLKTNVITYDLTTNEAILLSSDGTSSVKTSVVFNNVVNAVTYLLRAGASTTTSTGANNPLHEFRLYNRAMSLTQMQNLQTELNNKYTP